MVTARRTNLIHTQNFKPRGLIPRLSFPVRRRRRRNLSQAAGFQVPWWRWWSSRLC